MHVKMNKHGVLILSIIIPIFLLTSLSINALPAYADAVIGTVNVGSNPISVDINTSTNKIYVANRGDNTVTVIDGSTNMDIATIPFVDVGNLPSSMAINPVTNKIYVNDVGGGGIVTVIDGSTDTVVATIPVGNNPQDLAINTAAKKSM